MLTSVSVPGRYQLDVYLGKALVKGSPTFFNIALEPAKPSAPYAASSIVMLSSVYLAMFT